MKGLRRIILLTGDFQKIARRLSLTREEHLRAIQQADKAYYEMDNPMIPDAVYDEMRRSYIEKYGAADLDYTPGAVSEGFVPFHHPVAVTSLAKIKAGETDELHKWREKLSPVVLEPKYDGLTVVAYPQRDGSYKFVTRGSGTDGEVLPNFIHRYEGNMMAKGTYAIRGEVVLTKAAFKSIQEDQKARGEEPFKNIRNAAAGILRSKERSPYIDKLTYICYDVVGWDVSEKEKLAYIIYDTPFTATKCSDDYVIDTPDDYIWEQAKKMFELVGEGLPLDGIVMKTQKAGSLAELGSTGHHPNNAVALKPSRTLFKTTVRSIEFSAGRTKVTPVAIFDPVEIDDTKVTRASIHNRDYFDRMALCEGDTVYVYKSNEIIPQIDEESIVHNGGKRIEWPEEAVSVDEKLVRDLMHMVSKPVLDIKGFSEKTARKLVENEVIEERNDIFRLDADELAKLDGLGEKSAQKIIDQIAARKAGTAFPRFMRALCVPGIGAHVGEAIEGSFETLGEFKQIMFGEPRTSQQEKRERLLAIDGIGPEIADEVASADFEDAFKALEFYISIEWEHTQEAVAGASDFAGKSFVLTGKMAFPRSHYEELIKAAGGIVQSAVNGKTNYLVIADVNSTSTKARKARELGTELVSPEQLEEMLR